MIHIRRDPICTRKDMYMSRDVAGVDDGIQPGADQGRAIAAGFLESTE